MTTTDETPTAAPTPVVDDSLTVLEEIALERLAQDEKWGEQNHPDGTGSSTLQEAASTARARCEHAFKVDNNGTWRHIMQEEVAEAVAEGDPAKLRAELVQVAAVAVAWIEAIDRRS